MLNNGVIFNTGTSFSHIRFVRFFRKIKILKPNHIFVVNYKIVFQILEKNNVYSSFFLYQTTAQSYSLKKYIYVHCIINTFLSRSKQFKIKKTRRYKLNNNWLQHSFNLNWIILNLRYL